MQKGWAAIDAIRFPTRRLITNALFNWFGRSGLVPFSTTTQAPDIWQLCAPVLILQTRLTAKLKSLQLSLHFRRDFTHLFKAHPTCFSMKLNTCSSCKWCQCPRGAKMWLEFVQLLDAFKPKGSSWPFQNSSYQEYRFRETWVSFPLPVYSMVRPKGFDPPHSTQSVVFAVKLRTSNI